MVRRLLLIMVPCFLAAIILLRYSWLRFEPSQLNLPQVPVESPAENLVLGEQDQATPSADTAKVIRVIDGDTVELEGGERVRYIGIDTPETQHPTQGKECYGSEARDKNKSLVEGKTVRLESDRSNTDRYDRLLRYVWVDDVLVNQVLVAEGFAFANPYPPDTRYQALFEMAEVTARLQAQGLWAVCPIEDL